MGGRRCGNEHSFRAAVLHHIFRVREERHRGRQILRGPLVGTGLGVACRDEFDARLLVCEDTGTDGTQAPEPDQGEFETTVGSHLVLRDKFWSFGCTDDG